MPRYNPGMVAGHATPSATQSFAARHASLQQAGFYRSGQGLTVSSLGIGTYLGRTDEDTDRRYEQAISAAIRAGINFIDTSLNYRRGRSEKNIGAALEGSGVARDELVVCTKAGYLIPGATPDLDTSDIAGGNHSIAPVFLRDQIERSRANLRLGTVDVLYLHNPETQLAHVSHEEFDARVLIAFTALEELRASGKVRFYGAATWDGFRKPGLLSFPRMLNLAQQAGGDTHGFRFVQLPLNLAMREGFTNGLTQQAADAGVTVVTSASILQSKLASGMGEPLRAVLAPGASDAQRAIQFARSTPGVTVSLVGMSRREHVDENIGVAGMNPMPREQFLSLVGRL